MIDPTHDPDFVRDELQDSEMSAADHERDAAGEFTPSTEQVRMSYAAAVKRYSKPQRHGAEAAGEFDRWLRRHDAEVAAKAWDEGWNASADYMSDDYDGPDDVANPYGEATS